MPSQEEQAAQSALDAAKYAHRNDITRVVPDLKASLPSMKKGGVVAKTGPVLLHKGETVVPNPEDQSADTENGSDSGPDDDTSETPVKIQQAFSKLNLALTKLADENGVRRSATIPYVHGAAQHEHIAAVGDALKTAGGLSGNLLTTHHTPEGRGWGSGDGSTQAWPIDKLRQTVITKDDKNAITAISAARSFISKVESLIGETPEVLKAKSQLKIVGHANLEGVTLSDAIIALLQIVHSPYQALVRQHSRAHPEGMAVHLRAPHNGTQES